MADKIDDLFYVPPTRLFDDFQVVTVVAGKSKYDHTFGGPVAHHGAKPGQTGGLKLHLLYELNLADPLSPLKNFRYETLPLYYCFDSRANTIAYHISKSRRFRLFLDHEDTQVTTMEEFPEEPFPKEFPRTPVKVKKAHYDPTNLEDALRFNSVFGLNKLTPEDHATAMKQSLTGYRMINGEEPESMGALLETYCHPFAQGRPDTPCLNPDCSHFRSCRAQSPFCIVPSQPVPKTRIWGQHGQGVIIIFEICIACDTIHVTNQCT